METICIFARRAALGAVILATMCAGAARADSVSPLLIPPGLQLWKTLPGSFLIVSLPAGSLGTQNGNLSDALSDVIINSVGLGGSSGGTQSPLQFDTPMESLGLNFSKIQYEYKVQKQQPADTTLKHAPAKLFSIGSTDTVPIEIVSMSLMSSSPVTITYGGGASSSFFDVFVELDPASIQQPGSLTLQRTGTNSGAYQFALPIIFRLTFTNTSPSGPQANGPLVFTETFVSNGNFRVTPEPGTLALVALGAAGIFARRRRQKIETRN